MVTTRIRAVVPTAMPKAVIAARNLSARRRVHTHGQDLAKDEGLRKIKAGREVDGGVKVCGITPTY